MEIFYLILLIAGGFLLGSIMFGELIPKLFLHKSIYEISEDHNPGTFNAFKYCGIKTGLICLTLDVLKGFLPVLLASLFTDADSFAFSLVLLAPVLGHAIGLFNRFRGGKCIAVSFGVMLGLIPVSWIPFVTLTALYILFSTAVKIKSATKRSIVVYALFAIIVCPTLWAIGLVFPSVGCGLVSLLPIIKFSFSKRTAETKQDDGIERKHS